MVSKSGLRVSKLGCRVSKLGFIRASELGFRNSELGFGVSESGFRVQIRPECGSEGTLKGSSHSKADVAQTLKWGLCVLDIELWTPKQ